MRKVVFPLAFVATSTLMACSFQMRAGSQNPQQQQQASRTTTPTNTTPTAAPKPSLTRKIGKRTSGPSGPTPTPTGSQTTAPAPTPTTPPSGAPVITGATIFGSGTVDTAGFKGNLYRVPAGTTKIPALASQTAVGYLFTRELNVTPQTFATGFPGVDATLKENFAIRYEAPLIVTTEADYDFRLVADDGAILLIDQTPIVDNDGVKTAPAEKTGPVHLVPGSHLITVDYFQTTGTVALQLYCKKANDVEKICPTQL